MTDPALVSTVHLSGHERRAAIGARYRHSVIQRIARLGVTNAEPELMRLAHYKVAVFSRKNRGLRKPCIACAAPESEGHHVDYRHPLLVIWLCLTCHRVVHAIIKSPESSHIGPLGAGFLRLWTELMVAEGLKITASALARRASTDAQPVQPSSPWAVVLDRNCGMDCGRLLSFFGKTSEEVEQIGA